MSDYLQDDPRPTWDDIEEEVQSLQAENAKLRAEFDRLREVVIDVGVGLNRDASYHYKVNATFYANKLQKALQDTGDGDE
jgi:regulator of replication initiation timing